MKAASPEDRSGRRSFSYPGAAVGRPALIWLAACVIGLTGCPSKAEKSSAPAPAASQASSRTQQREPGKEQLGWLTISLVDPPAASVMGVLPENLPAYVQSLYRLRPDRRFLYAAAELARLTEGGGRSGTLSLRFEGNRWRLSLDGSTSGDLPEYPDFADAKKLLLAHVPRLAKLSDGIELSVADRVALEDGSPADLFPVLARLNAAWNDSPGDPAVAEAALRGLLWLALQTHDELELTDPILGKALALFAIAEARAPGRLAREECLLASLLGYEDHATAVARVLPEDDPVRAYAEWDLAGLKAIVRQPPHSPRSQYLYLLRLAENRPSEDDWFRELESSSWSSGIDCPSLRLVLALSPFSWRTVPSTLMESEVFEEVSAAPAPKDPSARKTTSSWQVLAAQRMKHLEQEKGPLGRLSELEAAVDREASRLDGPLLDRDVVRAHRLANFYSSVYAAAQFEFDKLSSTEAAESLGNALVDPPPGTAVELKDWILHRVRLRRSPDGLRDVVRDLGGLRHIGTAPLSRISYSIAISGTGTEPYIRAAVPGFFKRLDSRPANLHAAFRTASELLSDPGIAEQCMRLSAKRCPRELDGDLPWALRFLGDPGGLRALANDKAWSAATRSSAFQELAKLEGIDSRTLLVPMRELIREDPSDNKTLRAAVAILEKEDQIEAALQLIDSWLDAHPESDLQWAGVASLKSRLLRKRGRIQEAWKFSQPAAETWKAECLEEAALTLLDLGRVDDALEMAKRSLERYGDDDEAVLVARILWMKGKDKEAAALLTPPTRQLDSRTWAYRLPAAFLEAFPKADDARGEAVFSELAVPSVPKLNIVWFIEYLTGHGRPQLALKLCERLRGGGAPAGFAAVASYHALLKARSAAEARQWLRANTTPRDMDVLAKQALLERDYDLAWDLPDHPDPTKNEILHMIRAVCLLYQPEDSADRRASLIKYFEGRPKKDFAVYGLYFLGQVDKATLFAQIQDPSYVASVGWILGVTSAQAGRYDEANSWLQVCMEAGANIPPRSWTSSILGRWKAAGCGLSELARQRIS